MATSGHSFIFYRKRMQEEFAPGGQGYRWMDRVRFAMVQAAIAAAPSRTGTLARSHRSSIRGRGGWRCDFSIVNVAEHAEWVHNGTQWIEATMRVPRSPGPFRGAVLPRRQVFYTDGKGKNATGVAGQDAQPWLDDSCTLIAMRNGAVPYG